MTKIRQSFLQTKWPSVKIGHQRATYYTVICFLSSVILQLCPTQEEAKVFGLNGADPNFVSS